MTIVERDGAVNKTRTETKTTYHVTVDFSWDGTADAGDKDAWKKDKRYELTAHLDVDRKTNKHTNTEWFDTKEFAK